MSKPNPTIVAIGAYPPPLTGQSKNLALITDDLNKYKNYRVIKRNIAAGSVRKNVKYFLRKSLRIMKAIATIPSHSMKSSKRLYVVSDGGLGQLYTILIVTVGRLFGYRIILQHRTFRYIERQSSLTSILNFLIGKKGKHVFLSNGMAQRYSQYYKPKRPFLINHNLAQFSEFWSECRKISTHDINNSVMIGFLSNLLPEKGVDTFIEMARLAKAEGLPLKFVVAGPAPGKSEEQMIESAVEELDGVLQWIGQVFGKQKVRFYRSIDIFVFPTRYKFEAQPNVVLEAFCAGCYVVASDRGCIGEDIVAMGGGLIPESCSNSAGAFLEHISEFIRNPKLLTTLRAKSLLRTRARYREARSQYENFLECFSE